MDDTKRMAETFEILQAIHIGDKEIVFGEDRGKTNGYCYLLADYTNNDIFGLYSNALLSNDYLEIMEQFTQRVQGQIEAFRAELSQLTAPQTAITAEQCIPFSYGQNIDGKVVAMRTAALRDEYRVAAYQVKLIDGGFGAQANARGRKVYTVNLYDGHKSYCYREDLYGEIRPEHIPAWAKEKLAELQKQHDQPQQANTGPKKKDEVER